MSNFEPKIIVIGERAIDHNVILRPLRLNPEQPNSVVTKPVGESVTGGMAENVYNNLRSLGLKESEICFITNKTAIVKKRFIEEMTGATMVRIDENDDVITKNHEYFDGDTFKDLRKIIENYKTIKMVAISDYEKNFLDTYWLQQIFELCDKHGIKTIIDTRKKLNCDWSDKADFVKINSKEYAALGAEASQYCRNLFVTLGSRGVQWVNQNKIYPTIPVVNPISCGAGDSFQSAFCYKYMICNDIEESLKFANKAAMVVVKKPGTATVSIKEIEELG